MVETSKPTNKNPRSYIHPCDNQRDEYYNVTKGISISNEMKDLSMFFHQFFLMLLFIPSLSSSFTDE